MSKSIDVLAVVSELKDETCRAARYSGEGSYWHSKDDDDLLRRAEEAMAKIAELQAALNAQAGVLEALEWIARVNATEAEYQKVARAALAAVKGVGK